MQGDGKNKVGRASARHPRRGGLRPALHGHSRLRRPVHIRFAGVAKKNTDGHGQHDDHRQWEEVLPDDPSQWPEEAMDVEQPDQNPTATGHAAY